MNELRMKLVDLETRSYKGGSRDGNFLARRIQDVILSRTIRLHFSWRRNYKNENENSLRNREWIETWTGNSNLSNPKLIKKKKRDQG